MALRVLSSKNCLLVFMIITIILILFIYENNLHVHQNTGSWSNVVSRYIHVPTPTKNCTGGDGKPYLIPPDEKLRGLSEATLASIYWKYINTIQALCRNQTRFGSIKDGGKEVCLDNKYRPSSPCLVYSFGSNYQFDFETAIKNTFNCEIHTFDPSMTSPNPRLRKTIPTGITTFHKYGLDGRDFKNKKNWEMRSLTSIREELKHEEKVIDILKIDVEGGEWRAFPEIYKSGVLKYVKQICLEVHYGRESARGFWGEVGFLEQLGILRQLYQHGFYIFMREHNMFSIRGSMTNVNEISLVNINWIGRS